MSAVPQYLPQYTVDDYQQWDGDWELIDGLAIAMSPSPFGPHQLLQAELLTQLVTQLKSSVCSSCFALAEIDWIVNENTVVRPDIIVTCHGVPERHLETTPTLIVEILSPSTEQKDRNRKRDLYEQQGVTYYLLADPKKKSLEVLSLRDGVYEPQSDSHEFTFSLSETCTVSLKIE